MEVIYLRCFSTSLDGESGDGGRVGEMGGRKGQENDARRLVIVECTTIEPLDRPTTQGC